MGFHEEPGDTSRHRGTRQHGHEFTLPSARCALPAGQLHRVGRVEHHRATGVAHDGQRAHIGNQIVVAERDAAFAHHDVVRTTRLTRLVDHVFHVTGREKLPLLDIDRLAGACHGVNEISLTAKKGRRLQYVNRCRNGRDLFDGVHIGQHRHTEFFFYGGENLKPLVHAKPAIGLAGTAVGFVIRGFIDEGHAHDGADLLQPAGGVKGHFPRLDDTGAGDEEHGLVQTGLESAQLHHAAAERGWADAPF